MPEPLKTLYVSTEASLRGKPQHIREELIKTLGESLREELEGRLGPRIIALSRKRYDFVKHAGRSKAEILLQQVELEEAQVWKIYDEELAMLRSFCMMLSLSKG